MTRTDDHLNVVLKLDDGRIAVGQIPILARDEAAQLHAELGKVLRSPEIATTLPTGLRVTP